MVRDGPCGSSRNSWADYRMGQSPDPIVLFNPSNKVSLLDYSQTVGKRRNVSRAHFRKLWLVVKWCNEQSYIYRQSPKWVNAYQRKYATCLCWIVKFVLSLDRQMHSLIRLPWSPSWQTLHPSYVSRIYKFVCTLTCVSYRGSATTADMMHCRRPHCTVGPGYDLKLPTPSYLSTASWR